MQVQSIRFALREWEQIKETADSMGMSASQFVRNAARSVVLIENAQEAERLRAVNRGFAVTGDRAGQESPPTE